MNIEFSNTIDKLATLANLIQTHFLSFYSVLLIPVFVKIWKICKPTYIIHKNLISKSIKIYYLYSNISSDIINSKSDYSKSKAIKAHEELRDLGVELITFPKIGNNYINKILSFLKLIYKENEYEILGGYFVGWSNNILDGDRE